jgi:hypothetical protein
MIDFTKPLTTRDGREVVIFGTDFDGVFPVRGYLIADVPKRIRSWDKEGIYRADEQRCELDLINPKPRITGKVYLNVYKGEFLPAPHLSAESARRGGQGRDGRDTRFACIEVDIDCEEGEGL